MATKKKLASSTEDINTFDRMDYPSNSRLFGGLSSKAFDGDTIKLPTKKAKNFDKFYCVDTGETCMFYDGTWYKI